MNLLCEGVRFRVDEGGIRFRVDNGVFLHPKSYLGQRKTGGETVLAENHVGGKPLAENHWRKTI
jgi:hypothetical protein